MGVLGCRVGWNGVQYSCAEAGCKEDNGPACDQAGKKIVYGQKPPGLMGYLAARFTTHPGQLVLDPFMGSGASIFII